MKEATTAMGSVRMGIRRRAKMEQKDDDHQADDDGLFQQVALQRADRLVDQPGPVIACNHFDSRGQRGLDLSQFLLHTVDDIQCVHSIAHHHDAAHCFSLTVPLGDTLANIGTEADRSDIPNQNGHAVFGGERDVFEIAQ